LEDAGCPFPKGVGEGLRSSCTGQLGKKALDVSIAVRTLSPGEHTQGIPTVCAQIAGATQTDGTKEEQREQEHATRRRGEVCQARLGASLTRSQGNLQGGKQIGFLSSR